MNSNEPLFSDLFSMATLKTTIAVAIILIVGLALVRLLSRMIRRFSRKGMPLRNANAFENLVKYGGYILIILTAARRAGLDISAMLGAAGIAGVALGFAAQTSVSNMISGLFLFSERAFNPGDVIQIDSTTGVVESIDLLSIRVKTFDNRLVRVPNETLIKSNIVNVSYYPERRYDTWLSLPYGCDCGKAMETIRAAIAYCPDALAEPAPFISVDSLGPDGVSLQIGVWFKRESMLAMKNSVLPAILSELAKIGIIPQARRIEISQIDRSADV